MEEQFISDHSLFAPSFDALIDENNIEKIVELLTNKHKYETIIDKIIEDKKIELYMWQAILVRKLSFKKSSVANTIIHETYNKFYAQIKRGNSLHELQSLEIKLFSTYSKLTIYNTESTDHYTLNRILKCIHLHIEDELSLNILSEKLSLSKPYISTLFKTKMSITIMQYVSRVKINRAKSLLETTTLSIMEISQRLGFHDSSHFYKKFKGIVGLSPREYRNNNKQYT